MPKTKSTSTTPADANGARKRIENKLAKMAENEKANGPGPRQEVQAAFERGFEMGFGQGFVKGYEKGYVSGEGRR
jgi:flagellar biosynthesis/type III secretory pathway protein FliH